MLKKYALWINRLLWTLMVSALIIVASYVSIGRYYIDYVEQYQGEIVGYVADYTELPLTIENIAAKWSILSPVLSLRDLALPSPVDGTDVLRIDSVSFQLDLFKSFVNRTIQVRNLQINGVECSVEEVQPGKWQLQGYASNIGSQNQYSGDFDKIIDIILSVDAVALSDAQLNLYYFEDDDHAVLNLDEVSLVHAKDFRRARIKASFENTNKPLLAIVESIGDPRNAESFLAKAYLKLDDINFESQLPAIKSLGIDLRYAQVDSEIWLDLMPLREISIQGMLKIPLIDLAAISGETVPSISDFALHFRAEKKSSDDWNFWLPLVTAQWHEEDIEFNNIFIELDEDNVRVSLPEIDLEEKLVALTGLNVLNDRVTNVIETLKPVGKLENFHLQLPRSLVNGDENTRQIDSKNPILVQSNLNRVGVSAWKGAPAVSNVSGYLELTPSSGIVDLESTAFSMSFPTVYTDPLDFDTARGQVRWTIGNGKVLVKSGLLHLTADHGPATALLALDLPLEKTPQHDPLMTLVIGLKDTDANYRNKFIPKVLNQGFRDWLNGSIPSGNVVNGGFIYRGSLIPGDVDDKTVQLFLDVENTRLDYHPQWPALDEITGLVMVDDINTTVTASSAKLYGMDVESTRVELTPIDEGGIWLTVDAQVNGKAKSALRVVNESALRATVGTVFENWALAGEAKVTLDLGIPLNQPQLNTDINIEVELNKADLFIPDYRVSFSNISGPLNYNSDDGLFSNTISGELYGKPVNVSITQGDDKKLTVDMSGMIDLADVEDWSHQPALTFFSGETEFNAQIEVIPNGVSQFTVSSDLLGISVDFPEPYGKPSDKEVHFSLRLPLKSESQFLTMTMGDQVGLQLAFDKGLVNSGVLQFDSSSNSSQNNFLTDAHDIGFLSIIGEIDDVVLEQWQSVLERYLLAQEKLSNTTFQENTEPISETNRLEENGKGKLVEAMQVEGRVNTTKDSALGVKVSNLIVNNFDMYDQKFSRTVINGEYKTYIDSVSKSPQDQDIQGWLVTAENATFNGDIFLPDGSFSNANITSGSRAFPLQINLLRLTLPENIGDSEDATLGTESAKYDPTSFNTFSADVKIQTLMMGSEILGNIGFEVRPLSKGIRFSELQGTIRGVTLNGSETNNLDWWIDAQGNHSQLRSSFSIKNLGDVLENWSYQRIIESESGGFVVDLNWPGSPDQWELKKSNGTVDLHLSEGRFLNTSDVAEGGSKVVSIINLASVLSLQSSFSDLFGSGISFDQVDGQINLFEHELSIVDNISIASSSSEFNLQGTADMEAQLLDMELIVTLPVADNLPWIAAFAGGLPIAAGVYVVSKIFKKQVEKFSSGVYTIEGDWNDPTMEFKRVFGDASNSKSRKKLLKPNTTEQKSGAVIKTNDTADDKVEIPLPNEERDEVDESDSPITKSSAGELETNVVESNIERSVSEGISKESGVDQGISNNGIELDDDSGNPSPSSSAIAPIEDSISLSKDKSIGENNIEKDTSGLKSGESRLKLEPKAVSNEVNAQSSENILSQEGQLIPANNAETNAPGSGEEGNMSDGKEVNKTSKPENL